MMDEIHEGGGRADENLLREGVCDVRDNIPLSLPLCSCFGSLPLHVGYWLVVEEMIGSANKRG